MKIAIISITENGKTLAMDISNALKRGSYRDSELILSIKMLNIL